MAMRLRRFSIPGVLSMPRGLALLCSVNPVNQMSITEQIQNSDFLLVLGHVLNADGTPKRELVARLEMAFSASEIHPAAKLVVSGGGKTAGFNEAEVMKRWLEQKGVASSRILMELDSQDTVENIILSTSLLNQLQAQSVCLITGAHHMDRALCLLISHLKFIRTNMRVFHLISSIHEADRTSKENRMRERFLLIKDLGRIYGIWQNRDWVTSVEGAFAPLLKMDACHNRPKISRVSQQIQI